MVLCCRSICSSLGKLNCTSTFTFIIANIALVVYIFSHLGYQVFTFPENKSHKSTAAPPMKVFKKRSFYDKLNYFAEEKTEAVKELEPVKFMNLDPKFIRDNCSYKLDIQEWSPKNWNTKSFNVCLVSSDQVTKNLIKIKGNVEPDIQKNFFTQVFPKHPNAAFLDIGANIGAYSISAAILGRKVYAFEPVPKLAKSLSQTVKLNNLTNRINLYPYAVMDKKSCVFQTKNSQIARDPDCSKNSDIETVTLDDVLPMLQKQNISEVIVKIDVDELEPYVILGGQKFLEQMDVPYISMKFQNMADRLKSNSSGDEEKQKMIRSMLTALSKNFNPATIGNSPLETAAVRQRYDLVFSKFLCALSR